MEGDEPRELTVEELEAQEIAELPDREAMSIVRSPLGTAVAGLPLPEGLPDDAGDAADARTGEGRTG
jgi:hypothetical protein